MLPRTHRSAVSARAPGLEDANGRARNSQQPANRKEFAAALRPNAGASERLDLGTLDPFAGAPGGRGQFLVRGLAARS